MGAAPSAENPEKFFKNLNALRRKVRDLATSDDERKLNWTAADFAIFNICMMAGFREI